MRNAQMLSKPSYENSSCLQRKHIRKYTVNHIFQVPLIFIAANRSTGCLKDDKSIYITSITTVQQRSKVYGSVSTSRELITRCAEVLWIAHYTINELLMSQNKLHCVNRLRLIGWTSRHVKTTAANLAANDAPAKTSTC